MHGRNEAYLELSLVTSWCCDKAKAYIRGGEISFASFGPELVGSFPKAHDEASRPSQPKVRLMAAILILENDQMSLVFEGK